MTDRRAFLATGAAALLATALPASAAPISLNEISRYLNGITTAEAQFRQINADGTISTGKLYIKRPGRMRFDYDAPDETLVMAGGGQVAIFDAKSNSVEPEQYPLARTPLSLILERNVDLGRRNMVVGHREDGNKTIVTAQDPAHPEYGQLEMVFTANPVQLRQWVVVDDTGTRTTTVLGALKTGGNYSSTLFNIPYEVGQRGG